MKRPDLHQLAIVIIAAGTFLSSASFAQANTFTVPQTYHYSGLTFSEPLTYSKPLSIPQTSTTVSFTSKHKLTINKDDTLKPLEAIVITPTLTESATPTEDGDQPTPTLFDRPTLTPTSEPAIFSSTPMPTISPTATPTSPSYTPVPQTNAGGLNADDIFSMVNAYRASQGLPAFQQDAKMCSLAQERAPEIAGEIASGNMHAGLKARNLPYWETENIISMNSDQAAFNWWINDPIHHAAIVSGNTFSCVACSGNACSEEFTSYVAK